MRVVEGVGMEESGRGGQFDPDVIGPTIAIRLSVLTSDGVVRVSTSDVFVPCMTVSSSSMGSSTGVMGEIDRDTKGAAESRRLSGTSRSRSSMVM